MNQQQNFLMLYGREVHLYTTIPSLPQLLPMGRVKNLDFYVNNLSRSYNMERGSEILNESTKA